jgi:hypothetical protein
VKYNYRITKYDPGLRNDAGHYTREEWTHFAQVGKRVAGRRLTAREYLRTEALYLSALKAVLLEANVSSVQVRGLWLPARTSAPLRAWRRRHTITIARAIEFAQLALRNQVGGQLIAPRRAYVHFGWDYYMYLGVSRKTPKALAAIQSSGLFVESHLTPYSHIPASKPAVAASRSR